MTGMPIIIGGKEYIVTPLTQEEYEKIVPITWLGDNRYVEQLLTVMARVVHAALKKNYPEMAVKSVEELLDFGDKIPTRENQVQLTEAIKNAHLIIEKIVKFSNISPLKGSGTRH